MGIDITESLFSHQQILSSLDLKGRVVFLIMDLAFTSKPKITSELDEVGNVERASQNPYSFFTSKQTNFRVFKEYYSFSTTLGKVLSCTLTNNGDEAVTFNGVNRAHYNDDIFSVEQAPAKIGAVQTGALKIGFIRDTIGVEMIQVGISSNEKEYKDYTSKVTAKGQVYGNIWYSM